VAHRVSEELAHIHPRPPAVRVFDAGVGDGSVLVRVMRAMHDRYPHMPFYTVGKEISPRGRPSDAAKKWRTVFLSIRRRCLCSPTSPMRTHPGSP